MNELVFKSKNGSPITTSLLVAEKFGKDHKNVMRDIREIMNKRSAQNWSHFYYTTSYIDSMNRRQEMIAMNRDGFSLLVMGFTGEEALQFKLDFISAFNKMEQTIKLFDVPKTYADALQLAANQAKEIELKNNEIKELAPKAEVYDLISESKGLKTVKEVAKELGTGEHRLFAWLRDQHILMRSNIPYQKYIEQGYFEVKSRHMPNLLQNYSQTFITGKGETWLAKVWKSCHEPSFF